MSALSLATESTYGATASAPRWATLQRELIALLEAASWEYLEKYTRPDGSLEYSQRLSSRDGADDFYESFYPLPYLYLLGGSDRLLAAAHHHWEGATRQITDLGLAVDEYERGYDWFHQGEAQLLFYGLCLADPENAALRSRALRFARLYADGPNYDPERNMMLAPHTGSGGPRAGHFDVEVYPWHEEMARYGLPLEDVEGIEAFDDLRDPRLARRMGHELNRRASGDVAVNLATLALVANAFALGGQAGLRDWIARYADGWLARAAANAGMLPDNVGPGGTVGESFGGRWFGAPYGWTWPHGLLSVGTAAAILATVSRLATGRDDGCEPLRAILDTLEGEAKVASLRGEQGSLLDLSIPQFPPGHDQMLLAPHRRGCIGWFDYQPMLLELPTALWCSSLLEADWEWLERWRAREGVDWREVTAFRTKEDSGHERPWLAFLAGDNPAYPERMLDAAIDLVRERRDAVAADRPDPAAVDIHHWQEHNPATLEALCHLTLGGPPPLYNGGLLLAAVRHFDLGARRPGLPPDVAALVTRMGADGVALELVNLSPVEPRHLAIQAGVFAEHTFTQAIATEADGSTRRLEVGESWVEINLPPNGQAGLQLGWERYVNRATALPPWARSGA